MKTLYDALPNNCSFLYNADKLYYNCSPFGADIPYNDAQSPTHRSLESIAVYNQVASHLRLTSYTIVILRQTAYRNTKMLILREL